MYHLYHTLALVMGCSPRGEGSKVFSLFTRELGLVIASAQSVREERSKLRYGLQDFSLSEITLVRGKESWRLTSVTLEENLFSVFQASPEILAMLGRVFRLVQRLVAGEEKNEKLFDAVREAVEFLKAIRITNTDTKYENNRPSSPLLGKEGRREVSEIEIVLVLRILYLLGYLAPRGEFKAVLSDISLWNEPLLTDARAFRALALSEINQSLKATQL